MHLDVSVTFTLLTRWQYDACYTDYSEELKSSTLHMSELL